MWEYQGFKEYCIRLIDSIPWRNNYKFPDGITMQEAQRHCFWERDNGKTGAYMVMPDTETYNDWYNYWRFLRACDIYLSEDA